MLYRIDTFSIPSTARFEFERRSRETMHLLNSQEGCLRAEWFEKVSGAGSVDIVTIVAWRDQASIDAAGTAVRALHAASGFDATAFVKGHGILESKAVYALVEEPA